MVNFFPIVYIDVCIDFGSFGACIITKCVFSSSLASVCCSRDFRVKHRDLHIQSNKLMSTGRFLTFEQMEQLHYSDGEAVRFLDGEEVEVPFCTPELLARDRDDMLAGGGDLAQSLLVDSFDQLSGPELWMSGTADLSFVVILFCSHLFFTAQIVLRHVRSLPYKESSTVDRQQAAVQRRYYCP